MKSASVCPSGLTELQERRAPIQFQDVTADALLFPLKRAEDSAQRVLEHVQKHYEETWIHRPRRSLSGNTPVDAAAHPTLRKHLRGVIQFVQDCARGGMIADYDFDRLRRKLGLLESADRRSRRRPHRRDVRLQRVGWTPPTTSPRWEPPSWPV